MRFRSLLAIAASLAIIAGCSSTQTGTTAPISDSQSGQGQTNAGGPGTVDLTRGQGQMLGASELTDPKNVLSKRSVYFDFDSAEVKDEFRSMLQAHATYLQRTPSAKMLIQGNTDERGSREYNIALGQRRADAVKRTLVLLGAPAAAIETVSLGKEKPRRTGHSEADFAENRRGDILYSSGNVKEF
jgi:peptidoglycan-associated lipoprotein